MKDFNVIAGTSTTPANQHLLKTKTTIQQFVGKLEQQKAEEGLEQYLSRTKDVSWDYSTSQCLHSQGIDTVLTTHKLFHQQAELPLGSS